MTSAKLFEKLRSLTEDAQNTDKKHIRKMRKVLRKLKDRRNELLAGLEQVETSQEKDKMLQEIAVIDLQRSKGVDVYKQLKQARKQTKG